jgi:hypothetical protein
MIHEGVANRRLDEMDSRYTISQESTVKNGQLILKTLKPKQRPADVLVFSGNLENCNQSNNASQAHSTQCQYKYRENSKLIMKEHHCQCKHCEK